MSDTQEAAHGSPGNARVIEEHHIGGPRHEDATDATDDRGRAGTTSGRSLAAGPT